jgi:asparagine synthetase B (glutamine-hydrolysing)
VLLVGALAVASQLIAGVALAQSAPEDPRQVIDRGQSDLRAIEDERKAAERMSYKFNTEHYEMVLKAGDMERCMRSLVWHLEEPRVGQSYPNYYAAKLASRFGKVVLSGAGGDELFAGYPWRYYRAASAQNFDEYVDRYYENWQRLVPCITQCTGTSDISAAGKCVSLHIP